MHLRVENMNATSQYIDSPVKLSKPSKHVTTNLTKKIALEAVEPLSTPTIVWMLVRRHRVGLLLNLVIFENAYLVAHFFNVI